MRYIYVVFYAFHVNLLLFLPCFTIEWDGIGDWRK